MKNMLTKSENYLNNNLLMLINYKKFFNLVQFFYLNNI